MTLTAFLAYAAALAIAAAIPGPGIAALVGRALGAGFWRALPMMAGLALGDVVWLTLAVAGLSLLAKTLAGLFLIVKLAGAAYLLWLAWRFWNAGLTVRPAPPGPRDALAAFASGLAVTLGNPKVVVFYMALLPAVIDLSRVTATDWLVLVALTVAVLGVVFAGYGAMAAGARGLFADGSRLRLANRAAAAVMAATAGWIVARA